MDGRTHCRAVWRGCSTKSEGQLPATLRLALCHRQVLDLSFLRVEVPPCAAESTVADKLNRNWHGRTRLCPGAALGRQHQRPAAAIATAAGSREHPMADPRRTQLSAELRVCGWRLASRSHDSTARQQVSSFPSLACPSALCGSIHHVVFLCSPVSPRATNLPDTPTQLCWRPGACVEAQARAVRPTFQWTQRARQLKKKKIPCSRGSSYQLHYVSMSAHQASRVPHRGVMCVKVSFHDTAPELIAGSSVCEATRESGVLVARPSSAAHSRRESEDHHCMMGRSLAAGAPTARSFLI